MAWVLAVGAQITLFATLESFQGTWPQPSVGPRMIITLEPPAEGTSTQFLIASLPRPEIPPPVAATPITTPHGGIDDETRLMLEKEREELRARIKSETAAASKEISDGMQEKEPPPPPRPESVEIPIGTVRQLDLSGQPQPIVDEIMAKYRLRITQKVVSGQSNQSFLSSAAVGKGDQYFAGRGNKPGLYQVFELSRESVAKMSRLEEEEIRRRGLDPEKTRVKRVVFGIKETDPAQYDLGVLLFEAQPL